MMYFLKRPQKIVFACALSWLCFWGCGLKYQGKIYRKPVLSVKKTLSRLLERRDAFRDIRGRSSITVIRQGKKQSFLANVVFDSSYRLRIEGLGFLNIPNFFLVADGQWIWLYVPDERKILRGGSSEDNLFRLTGIQSRVEDLIALFSGNLPSDLSSAARLKVILANDNQALVELQSGLKELYRLWIDRERGVMVKMEVYGADQKLRLIASFDNYESVEEYNWPRLIECNFISSRIQLRIKYKRIFLNSGITESAFLLQYPPATVIEDLEEGFLNK